MKNLTKYILTIMVFTCMIACDTIFEPIDENRLDFDYISNDPESAEGLLLQGYSNLQSQNSFSESGTDDAVSNGLNDSFKRMALGELNAQFNPASRWGNYQRVFFINRFLEIIDAGEIVWRRNEEINRLFNIRMKGEALALRALHHFYILQAHAGKGESGELLGIPYYTKFIKPDGDFDIPRLTFKESVDAIMSDYNEALTLLPTDYVNNTAETDPFKDDIDEFFLEADPSNYQVVNGSQYDLRISGRIVRSLKARLALFAASPSFLNDQDYYNIAVESASEVLNTIGGIGGMIGEDGIEFYDDDNDPDSGEMIFRSSIQNPGISIERAMFPPSINGLGRVNPTQNFVDAFPMQDGFPISESNNYDPQNPYINRDPRLQKFVVTNGSSFGGGTINTGFGGKIDRLDSIVGSSTITGYYLKKLLRPDVRLNNQGSSVPQRHFNVYFRYTELFLIFAEAANEIDGPDQQINGISARDVIAAIRQRAGITQPDNYLSSITTKNDMRELIRNERRIELSFEGHRFWDLRRWGLSLNETARGYFFNGTNYVEIPSVEVRNYQPFAIYLPIPNSETLKFPSLLQNAGW
jgi:hypothetical protein